MLWNCLLERGVRIDCIQCCSQTSGEVVRDYRMPAIPCATNLFHNNRNRVKCVWCPGSLSVCLSVCLLSVCLFVCLCLCLSFCLSVSVFCFCLCLSVCLCLSLSLSLSVPSLSLFCPLASHFSNDILCECICVCVCVCVCVAREREREIR